MIADLTFLNPHTLYELGVRHALQAPVIHMQLEEYVLPFDVASYRSVVFSLRTPDNVREAQQELEVAIRDFLEVESPVSNPVTDARARMTLTPSWEHKSASPIPAPASKSLSLKQRNDYADRIETVAFAIGELRINSISEEVQQLLSIASDLRKSEEGAPAEQIQDLTDKILLVLAQIDKVVGSSRLGKLALSGALAALVTGGGLSSVAVFSLSLAVWEGPEFFRGALEKYLSSRRPSVSRAPRKPRSGKN
ncbi:hypothetical protein [Bradyrhizobium yuanmingense]|uniref:hypothetical protein n=1 Tax=Bradyrhizobium yuanmingense TaxID=108015 RepID=UPI001CD64992|nr:hypothetical protein [Bradyrhizobium yuanmingense]MCA1530415.1 hypothetical protein [Bradyrhizobium yuanmingense]